MDKYSNTELAMWRAALIADLFNLSDEELKELDTVEEELRKRGFKI